MCHTLNFSQVRNPVSPFANLSFRKKPGWTPRNFSVCVPAASIFRLLLVAYSSYIVSRTSSPPIRLLVKWLHVMSPYVRLRILVRRSEIWLTLFAAVIGAAAGTATVGISSAAYGIQRLVFGLSDGVRLSSLTRMEYPLAIFMPISGGIILVLATIWIKRRQRRMVDPVEANALHGGRMSMGDSITITFMTIISNGFGASVGLEAAYAQLGGALGSKLGSVLQARRSDIRLLLGCGTAGAIAAAFNAPFTGAFYAFELIIGTYTIAAVAPVMTSAIIGVLVAGTFREPHPLYTFQSIPPVDAKLFSALVGLSFIAAICAIGLMVVVSSLEKVIAATRIPMLYRPILGGVLLLPIAALTPFALSAGHGALIGIVTVPPETISVLLFMIAVKSLASAVSLASGFRGGLFFASLFLGSLVGQAYFLLFDQFAPGVIPNSQVAAVVGITGLAAAVVGGPLTMAFLALETSGNLPLTVIVMVGALVSSLLVRQLFGYTFTTWRFHLRGEAIRGAHDVGFIRSLTVGRMMRPDVRAVRSDMSVKELRRQFPLGSAKQIVAIDDRDQYAGILLLPDIFGLDEEQFEQPVSNFLTLPDVVLKPRMNARQAAKVFEASASDVLVVVSDTGHQEVIGLLSETYLLRRYAEELDKVRIDMSGDIRGAKAK